MSDLFNGWPEDGEPKIKWREDHCYKVESKMSDLIEKLRTYFKHIPECLQAADALEAKDRHNKELSELIDLNSKHDAKNVERIAELERGWESIESEEFAELESLLIRYMANVIDHEGVAFLDGNNYTFNLGPAEKAQLLQIEKKARKLLNE